MSTPLFPELDCLISRNPLKKLGGGRLIFIHSEYSSLALRTFIPLFHSSIPRFIGSCQDDCHIAGNAVASCERAHSKVKIINTYLRASMLDQRLEHLMRVSIERDIANKIELDSLLELFKTSGNRKLGL